MGRLSRLLLGSDRCWLDTRDMHVTTFGRRALRRPIQRGTGAVRGARPSRRTAVVTAWGARSAA
eukprot:7873261-Pyramimonas_sp.AAC.1